MRESVDVDELASGRPASHAAWLRAMTMAFGRDVLSPDGPTEARDVALRGLRAFADAGTPVTDDAFRAWARGRRFSDDAIETSLRRFRDLRDRARER